jgi:uncharacterized protein involved in outer membrane biogenesis
VAPFRLHGRLESVDTGYRFHNVRVQLGEYRAMANGIVGEPPQLIGTDFDLHAEGPSLVLFEQLLGLPPLPDEPFAVDGHLDGNPRRFKSDRIAVRLGESDVRGGFRVDLRDKPSLEARLESDRVDIARILEHRAARKREIAETGEAQPPVKRDRVIPDTPFELDVIQGADADVVWKVADLQLPVERITDITIDMILSDGRLQVGPLAATGSAGGKLDAELVLEPVESGYSLTAGARLEGGRLALSRKSGDQDERPKVDFYMQYSGAGATARDLASSSNGFFAVLLGEGVMDNSIVNLVAADILVTLLETLNPFAKEEDQSRMECAVILTTFDDGIARLEPMAIQTDKMTMLGGGTVDLNTEKLDLDWVTKPRKGFGLSASMITNPYIRLGGTLADPNLAMKPLEAMTTTGVAVATGGLSILGKGLWDRVTAEQKVCDKALKKTRKTLEGRGVKPRK